MIITSSFLKFTVISPDDGCSLSMATLHPVPSCPDTEQKLKEAVQKKRCENLANVQNCTTPKDFTYHCVLNSWKTGTVEVCASRILSQGKFSFFCRDILFSISLLFLMYVIKKSLEVRQSVFHYRTMNRILEHSRMLSAIQFVLVQSLPIAALG